MDPMGSETTWVYHFIEAENPPEKKWLASGVLPQNQGGMRKVGPFLTEEWNHQFRDTLSRAASSVQRLAEQVEWWDKN